MGTTTEPTPGHAIFRLICKKNGSTHEVRLHCRREPVTDAEKADGCLLAIRRDMRESRREYGIRTWPSQYRAEYVGFEPDPAPGEPSSWDRIRGLIPRP